jgi:hypothetical protein
LSAPSFPELKETKPAQKDELMLKASGHGRHGIGTPNPCEGT